MEKKFIWAMFFILFLLKSNVLAQAELSSHTKMYLRLAKKLEKRLNKLKKLEKQVKHLTNLKVDEANGYIISGVMKVDTKLIDVQALEEKQIKIGAKAKNIWTFRAPYHRLKALAKSKGVRYIEIDKAARLK